MIECIIPTRVSSRRHQHAGVPHAIHDEQGQQRVHLFVQCIGVNFYFIGTFQPSPVDACLHNCYFVPVIVSYSIAAMPQAFVPEPVWAGQVGEMNF